MQRVQRVRKAQFGFAAAMTLLLAGACQDKGKGTSVKVAGEDFSRAQASVETVMKKIADTDPSVLWRALPTSYRTDIEKTVRIAASKFDARVFDAGFEVAQLFVRVLREKKELILAQPDVRMMSGFLVKGGVKRLAAQWDGLLAPFETLLASEISTHDSFSQLDFEAFLRGTGGKLMRQFASLVKDLSGKDMLEQLRTMRVETASDDGKTAELRFDSSEGKRTRSFKFAKVGDRWLPAEMAQGFGKSIAKLQAKLETQAKQSDVDKMLSEISRVRAVLQQALATDDKRAFGELMNMMRGKRARRARPGR